MRDRGDTATLRTERIPAAWPWDVRSLGRAARREALYAVIGPALLVGEHLPRRTSAALYGAVGGALFRFHRGLRRRAVENLALAFPDLSPRDARRLARDSFRSVGRSAADLPRLRGMSRAALLDLVRIRGLERLRAAIAAGRGVVGIAPHLGNWEIFAAALAARGVPVTAVAAELYDPRLSRYLVAARRRWGVSTIVKGTPGATREALGVLQRGEMLGTLIDLHTRDEGIEARFLGRPSHTAAGPIRLALRTGAAVVPMAIVRAADGRYEAEIRDPLAFGGADGSARDVEEGVRLAAAALEAFIREHPGQWLWMHDRWPTRKGSA